jgi:hypothetical protein
MAQVRCQVKVKLCESVLLEAPSCMQQGPQWLLVRDLSLRLWRSTSCRHECEASLRCLLVLQWGACTHLDQPLHLSCVSRVDGGVFGPYCISNGENVGTRGLKGQLIFQGGRLAVEEGQVPCAVCAVAAKLLAKVACCCTPQLIVGGGGGTYADNIEASAQLSQVETQHCCEPSIAPSNAPAQHARIATACSMQNLQLH